jgi:hypothetical protein
MQQTFTTVSEFQLKRPEQYAVIKQITNDIKALSPGQGMNGVLRAPVKFGKKEAIQGLALMNKERQVYVLTNFNLIEVKIQADELRAHPFCCECYFGTKDMNDFIEKAKKNGIGGIPKNAIIVVDECDYGSGNRSKLTKAFRTLLEQENYVFLFVSATTSELEFIPEAQFIFKFYEPEVPATYFGFKQFREAGLLHQAHPAVIGGKITPHFEAVIEPWKTEKTFAFLRLSGREYANAVKPGSPFVKFLKERNIEIIPVNERTIFDVSPLMSIKIQINIEGKEELVPNWFSLHEERNAPRTPEEKRKLYNSPEEERLKATRRYLIIAKQKISRSTEIGFHPLIAFWHDYRKEGPNSTNHDTIIQASGRPIHYTTTYDENSMYFTTIWHGQKPEIHLYTCLNTIETYLGDMTFAQLAEKTGRKPNLRTSIGKTETTEWEFVRWDISESIHEANEKCTTIHSVTGEKLHFDKGRDIANTERNLAENLLNKKMTTSQDNGNFYKLNGPGKSPEHKEAWEKLMNLPEFKGKEGYYVHAVFKQVLSTETEPVTSLKSGYRIPHFVGNFNSVN